MVKESLKVVATNRAARHDFFIDQTFEAGLVLSGTEVKALRMGRATIGDGYIYIDGGEAWLENVYIPEYVQGTWTNHAPKRKRKLLLHHHEIDELAIATREKGHTIVPLRVYFVDGRAKIEIALARGKKAHDKRETIKRRETDRETRAAVKEKR